MKTVVAVVVSLTTLAMFVIGGLAVLGPSAKTLDAGGTAVRLENPRRGDLIEVVNATGELEPRSKVSISARVSARIAEIPYQEGDRVTKGGKHKAPSVLLRLDASDLEAALRSAKARREAQAAQIDVARARLAVQEAQIAAARAQLAEARLNLQRQEQLLASQDVSQAVVDTARKTVQELEAHLAAAEHTLEADKLNIRVMELNLTVADADIDKASEDLKYTVIESPIDGVITRINAEAGELVVTGTMNNPGTVIMEVADLSRMLFVAKVDEADIGALNTGQSAIVRLQAYPQVEFRGVVESIALRHDQAPNGSKYFKVEIALDTGGDRIYSGLTGDAEIETRRYADVLTLPSQAVLARRVDELPPKIRENNPNVDSSKTFAAVVYRMIDGKAVVTPVSIGASDPTHTIILDGVSENDRVVVSPYKVLETIAHDQRIVDEKEVEKKKKEGAAKDAKADKPAESKSDAAPDAPPPADDAQADK